MRADLAKEGKTTLGIVLYGERPDEKEYLATLIRDGAIVQGTEQPGTIILLPGGATETGAGDEEDRETTTAVEFNSGKFMG